MRFALGSKPDDWTSEAREWDVPLWFWEDFTPRDASTQNWETGLFAGQGRGPQGYGWITLNGVYFLRSSLDVLLPASMQGEAGQAQYEPPKPPVPDAQLQRWWDKRSPVRDALSQADLWTLAKADFPDHAVARERIRALSEGRTPGPKPS